MRKLLVERFEDALRSGESKPKVLLRFGYFHAKRGHWLDSDASTLADFVEQLAFLHGGHMLNIALISCHDDSFPTMPATAPACTDKEKVALRPFVDAAQSEWTLFDTRSFRKDRSVSSLPWEVREMVFGFDAIVILKTATPAVLVK